MPSPSQVPELGFLAELLGRWTIEVAHPAYPSLLVAGESQFQWLDGERFLLQRSRTEHADFPDTLSVIGPHDDGLAAPAFAASYFDSRGVHRVYRVEIEDRTLRMWRDEPGFSQRFAGTLSDDGATLPGLWELCRDNSNWDEDLRITYRRR